MHVRMQLDSPVYVTSGEYTVKAILLRGLRAALSRFPAPARFVSWPASLFTVVLVNCTDTPPPPPPAPPSPLLPALPPRPPLTRLTDTNFQSLCLPSTAVPKTTVVAAESGVGGRGMEGGSATEHQRGKTCRRRRRRRRRGANKLGWGVKEHQRG